MRLAIVHYHLRPGGVTRVIEVACRALAEKGVNPLIVSGEAPASPMDLAGAEIAVVPGLGYSSQGSAATSAALATALMDAAKKHFGAAPDVWHFHNPTLGKNPDLPPAVENLIRQGHAALLQIHDFAENARPANYRLLLQAFGGDRNALASSLYPTGARVKYAVLNRRDERILRSAGAEPVLLPNAVIPHPPSRSCFDPPAIRWDAFVFFPARIIRRKNLGEALLWAALAPKSHGLAIAMGAQSPGETEAYSQWVEFSRNHRLPVVFDALKLGGASMGALYGHCDFALTTSTAEGFGMAFLEPWVSGKGLQGRNLPDITGDFAEEGIDLADLYGEFPVPSGWVDREREDAWQQALRREAFESYGLAAGAQGEKSRGTTDPDFGNLSMESQRRVLERIVQSPESREELPVLNWNRPSPDRIRKNAALVKEVYSASRYGERLMAVYREIIEGNSDGAGKLDGDRILKSFLPAGSRLAD